MMRVIPGQRGRTCALSWGPRTCKRVRRNVCSAAGSPLSTSCRATSSKEGTAAVTWQVGCLHQVYSGNPAALIDVVQPRAAFADGSDIPSNNTLP